MCGRGGTGRRHAIYGPPEGWARCHPAGRGRLSPVLAHLSDLHLGHRAGGGEGAEGGIREADVRDAFLRAVRAVIRLRPDLVLITGDVFDDPHPGPGAVAALLQGIRSLTGELPRTPILVVAGARDTSPLPGAGPGPLSVLEMMPGVEVATRPPRSIHLADAGVQVLLVPHAALRATPPPPMTPDPAARWNVLALQGFEGGGPHAPRVDPVDWDWVALGGDHRSRSPEPGVRWAGSLERVSPDPWKEAGQERGFVTVDLASGAVTRHSIPGRPVVEVAPVHRGRQGLPRVNARLRAAVEAVPGGIDGKLVRLRIHGVDSEERLALDGAWLSVVRRRAARFQLQLRGHGDRARSSSPSQVPIRQGLRALVGGTARERHALLLDWRVDGPDGLPASPGPGDEPMEPGEQLIWAGEGPEDPEEFLEVAVRVLVDRGDAVDAGHRSGDDLPVPPMAPGGSPDAGSQSAVSEAREGTDPGDGAPDLSPGDGEAPPTVPLRDRLMEIRADAAEVDGEVEALTVEWLRERQDAETQLQSHRDRARELRGRIQAMESAGAQGPCPVCGRPLADHLTDVLASFRDEWETLVQDGTWWRRRREQLEPKPLNLREMEARGLRLHALLESAAEEREKEDQDGAGPPLAPTGGGEPSMPGGHTPGTPPVDGPGQAPEGDDAAPAGDLRRWMLERGSDLLNRLSDGVLAGVVERRGTLFLVMDGTLAPLRAGSDRAAVRLAFHLALVERTLERGGTPSVLRMGDGLAGLDPGAALRAVGLLRHLSRFLPGVLVEAHNGLLDRVPDRFDGIVELQGGEDPAGRPRLRLHPGGRIRIHLGPGAD